MTPQQEPKGWWHRSGKRSDSQPTGDNFRIYPSEDFDVVLMPFKIGVSSSYGPELVRRAFGAQLSLFMQLRSIDRILKKYVPEDFPNSIERDRSDEEIRAACIHGIESELNRIKVDNEINDQPRPLGYIIGDATLARFPFSLRQAFTMANRGALFECLCIVRMIMEQCAWACQITNMDDSPELEKTRGNNMIGALNIAHPNAGRFYGWLSAHAHWHFEAHGKSFAYADKYVGSILTSRSFKMLSFGALIVLTEVIERCLKAFRKPIGDAEDAMEQKARGTPSDLQILFEKLTTIEEFEEDLSTLRSLLINNEAGQNA
ncbi:MAG: hypothetical protein V3R90_00915 [Limibaculum sp.]